jgi:hypothetical protein
MILPSILVTRHQHILNFICVYRQTNLHTTINFSFCVFLYGIYVILELIYVISMDLKLMSLI